MRISITLYLLGIWIIIWCIIPTVWAFMNMERNVSLRTGHLKGSSSHWWSSEGRKAGPFTPNTGQDLWNILLCRQALKEHFPLGEAKPSEIV